MQSATYVARMPSNQSLRQTRLLLPPKMQTESSNDERRRIENSACAFAAAVGDGVY